MSQLELHGAISSKRKATQTDKNQLSQVIKKSKLTNSMLPKLLEHRVANVTVTGGPCDGATSADKTRNGACEVTKEQENMKTETKLKINLPNTQLQHRRSGNKGLTALKSLNGTVAAATAGVTKCTTGVTSKTSEISSIPATTGVTECATGETAGATGVSRATTDMTDGGTGVNTGATSKTSRSTVIIATTGVTEGATCVTTGATGVSIAITGVTEGATGVNAGATSKTARSTVITATTGVTEGATGVNTGATSKTARSTVITATTGVTEGATGVNAGATNIRRTKTGITRTSRAVGVTTGVMRKSSDRTAKAMVTDYSAPKCGVAIVTTVDAQPLDVSQFPRVLTGVNNTAFAERKLRLMKRKEQIQQNRKLTVNLLTGSKDGAENKVLTVHSLTSSLKKCQLTEKSAIKYNWTNCEPYLDNIIDYNQMLEKRFIVVPKFMSQSFCKVDEDTRSLLTDWMIQVQVHLNLLPQTLHLSVMMLDYYLANQPCHGDQVQLVGIACLLIAAKYEQRIPPAAEDLCYLTDNSYTVHELFAMERCVLKALQFHVSIPTPFTYINWLIQPLQSANQQTLHQQVERMSEYLLDLMLTNKYFSSLSASLRAACAVSLSCHLLDVTCHLSDNNGTTSSCGLAANNVTAVAANGTNGSTMDASSESRSIPHSLDADATTAVIRDNHGKDNGHNIAAAGIDRDNGDCISSSTGHSTAGHSTAGTQEYINDSGHCTGTGSVQIAEMNSHFDGGNTGITRDGFPGKVTADSIAMKLKHVCWIQWYDSQKRLTFHLLRADRSRYQAARTKFSNDEYQKVSQCPAIGLRAPKLFHEFKKSLLALTQRSDNTLTATSHLNDLQQDVTPSTAAAAAAAACNMTS